MRIERLDLIKFGHLTNTTLDMGDPRSAGVLEIVYGPNEAGKSTTLRAISNWLFGFPHSTKDDFRHSSTDLRVGGRLTDADGRTLDCIRRKGRRDTMRDGDDDVAIDEDRLRSFLGTLDKDAFESRFALSHDELRRGGEQIVRGEGELGAVLFAAGAGIGRLRQIQDQLTTDVASLFKTRGKSVIGDLIGEVIRQRGELKAVQVPPAEFADLRSRVDQQRANVKALKEQGVALGMRQSRLRARAAALPLAPRWRSANAEYREVADAPELPDDFASRCRDAQRDMLVAIGDLETATAQLAQLDSQLAELGDDSVILAHADEIDSLVRDLPIREKAESDRHGLLDQRRRCERRMRDRMKDLSNEPLSGDPLSGDPLSGETNDDETSGADSSHDALGGRIEQLQLTDAGRSRVQRLAGQFAKIMQQRDDAETLVAKLTAQIAAADAQWADIDGDDVADPAIITRAIQDIGRPEDLHRDIDHARASVQRTAAECRVIHGRLDVALDESDTVAMVLPDPARLTQLANEIQRQSLAIETARAAIDDAASSLAGAEADLAMLPSEGELPSPETLAVARVQRDNQLNELADTIQRGDSLGESIRKLRQSIVDADAIADNMRLHQETIHRRETAADMVVRCRRALDARTAEATARQSEADQTLAKWAEVWQSIGAPAKSPDAMRTWMIDHRALVEQHRLAIDATESLTAAEKKLQRAIDRLRGVVGEAMDGDDDANPLSLTQWFDRAHEVVDQRQRQRAAMDRLAERRERFQAEWVDATTMLDRRTQELNSWQEQWNEATAQLADTTTPSPADVLPMLDAIMDLKSVKRERDILSTRIASIQAETTTYLDRVARLAGRLTQPGDSPGSLDSSGSLDIPEAAELVEMFRERLQVERVAGRARHTASQQHAACTTSIATTRTRIQRLAIEQERLCVEAGCDSFDEIDEFERRARRRIAAAEKRDDLAIQLTQLAGDLAVEDFVVSLDGMQASDVEAELLAADRESEQLDATLDREQRDLWATEQELARIDGGGRATELAQSMQSTIGQLQRETERYARLKLSAAILAKSIEHYREQNQGPVLSAAAEMFAALTCGEYSGLKPDFDPTGKATLFGIRGGDQVPASSMSDGTADSLYLALRLASLKNQMRHQSATPLIIDDCLIQMDDDRAAAALNVLAEFTGTTQVILFTHHWRIVELARERIDVDAVRLHRLGGGETTGGSEPVSVTPKPKSRSKPASENKPVRRGKSKSSTQSGPGQSLFT